MRSTFFALMICCVSGCYKSDANLPRLKEEYGQRKSLTIAVTAGNGFKKPGVHHVPKGTTLRQFLDIAQILPNKPWGTEEFLYACRVRQVRNGLETDFCSHGEPSEKQYETKLEEGALVDLIKASL